MRFRPLLAALADGDQLGLDLAAALDRQADGVSLVWVRRATFQSVG